VDLKRSNLTTRAFSLAHGGGGTVKVPEIGTPPPAPSSFLARAIQKQGGVPEAYAVNFWVELILLLFVECF
jgi:hypothetical protein